MQRSLHSLRPLARRAAKLARLLTFAQGRHGLRYGVAATVEHRRALGGLPIATVVDIGANKGQFALLASWLYPDATIYSFEPLAEPAARFRELFGDRARLYETAIGSAENETTIYVSKRADSSSLLPIGKQSEIFPGTELQEQRLVSVAPLTKYLAVENIIPPALLKIDVQGYESEVLRGCGTLLCAFDAVYVECSYMELYRGQALVGDVISHLTARGFRLSGVYNQIEDRDDTPVEADLLFVKADGQLARPPH
jgi:FkbM family methyltransferase